MSRQIIYEPHPVSPERKKELAARGYAIIDARFAPKGYVPPADAGGSVGAADPSDPGSNLNPGGASTGEHPPESKPKARAPAVKKD